METFEFYSPKKLSSVISLNELAGEFFPEKTSVRRQHRDQTVVWGLSGECSWAHLSSWAATLRSDTWMSEADVGSILICHMQWEPIKEFYCDKANYWNTPLCLLTRCMHPSSVYPVSNSFSGIKRSMRWEPSLSMKMSSNRQTWLSKVSMYHLKKKMSFWALFITMFV